MFHTRWIVLVALALLVPLAARSGMMLPAAQSEPLPGGPGQPGVARPGGDLPGDPRIALVKVLDGLEEPLGVVFASDDDRVFILEKRGVVRIAHRDGMLDAEPLLDLSGQITAESEGGLLGLAFHPAFADNRQIFVSYTASDLSGALIVSRLTVPDATPLRADPDSEIPLLVIPQQSSTHKGGPIQFGPDGYLYVAVGDGGGIGDPHDVAQSRFALLGKILRLDVDGATADRPYGIPPDNPFVGPGRYDNPYSGLPEATDDDDRRVRSDPKELRIRASVQPEIWAFGLRNPWSLSFDPATGDAYIADVGASAWEEINYQPADAPAGINYGWDFLEASHCFPKERADCPRQQVGELPVAEFQHGPEGCAVIGIGVSRGEQFPSLDGIYFSADYCTGQIRGLQRDERGMWQFEDLFDAPLLITGSGQDAAGTFYLTAFGTPDSEAAGIQGGSVWTIASGAPAGEAPPEGTPAPRPQQATPVASNSAGESTPVFVIRGDTIEPDHVLLPRGSAAMLSVSNQTDAPLVCTISGLDLAFDIGPSETESLTIALSTRRERMRCDDPSGNGRPVVATIAARN